MLIKFNSDVGAFTMFGDVAVPLLKAMGHSGTVPGALLAADIPAALALLKDSAIDIVARDVTANTDLADSQLDYDVPPQTKHGQQENRASAANGPALTGANHAR